MGMISVYGIVYLSTLTFDYIFLMRMVLGQKEVEPRRNPYPIHSSAL